MRGTHRVGIAVAVVLVAVLAGCNAYDGMGDKNSREAKLEEARIAMDHGDFATAVALLQSLDASYPGDLQIARALNAAYSGRAGLSLLDLIARAKTALDNASLGTVNQLLKTLPAPVTGNNISDAMSAITGWQAIASTPNDFYSLALAQLTLALLTLDRDINPTGTGVNPALINDAIAFPAADALTFYNSLSDSLVNLGPGKAGLANDSDVLNAIAQVKSGIDGASGATIDAKLRNYLSGQNWI